MIKPFGQNRNQVTPLPNQQNEPEISLRWRQSILQSISPLSPSWISFLTHLLLVGSQPAADASPVWFSWLSQSQMHSTPWKPQIPCTLWLPKHTVHSWALLQSMKKWTVAGPAPPLATTAGRNVTEPLPENYSGQRKGYLDSKAEQNPPYSKRYQSSCPSILWIAYWNLDWYQGSSCPSE